ncbi:MAG: AAA family ATPase, partial [bacterium]|nr:AAA family ATPase [bacterium]
MAIATGFVARTLGTFSIARVEGSSLDVGTLRRQSGVLKYLLVQPGQSASSAAMAAALWPESDRRAARTNLRSAVHALRRTLAPHGLGTAILTERGRVALAPGTWHVDIDDFERLATEALKATPPDAARLRAAIHTYRGTLLPDDLYEPWSEEPRERLAALHRASLLRLAGVLADAESEHVLAQAERAARQAFESEPSDEAAAAILMRLQLRLGRRDDAIEDYRRHAEAIGGEGDVSGELRTLLTQARFDPSSAAGQEAQPPALWVPPSGPRFVGRQLEVARLGDLLDRAFEGAGGAALLIGDAGIGKTRTAAETITEAQDRGALVLAVSCWSAAETGTFSMLTTALDRVAESLAFEDLVSIFAGLAPRLLRLLPALRYRFPDATALPPLPGYLEIQRSRTALLSAIGGLARRWLVVLSIDDIHAANDQTVALLFALIKLAPAARLLVLTTARTPEFQGSAAAEVIELSCGAIEVMPLGPLEQREALDLAQMASTDRRVEPSEVALQSGGNPLFILELARGGGEITSELRAAAAGRIQGLSANDRRVVELAALARTLPLSETVIAAALSFSESQAIAACERMMALGMLQRDGRGYVLAHQVIAEVIGGTLAPARAEELHGLLGTQPALAQRPAIAAYHLTRAGARYTSAAIDATLAMIAVFQPVEDLTRHVSTLRLAYAHCRTEDPRRHTIALALGRVELEVGSSESADSVLHDALALARTPLESAAALVALAHLRALQLRVHEGLQLCDDAEQRLTHADVALAQNVW